MIMIALSYLIGVPLVKAKLAITVGVMWVVAATLIFLILHEVEIPAICHMLTYVGGKRQPRTYGGCGRRL